MVRGGKSLREHRQHPGHRGPVSVAHGEAKTGRRDHGLVEESEARTKSYGNRALESNSSKYDLDAGMEEKSKALAIEDLMERSSLASASSHVLLQSEKDWFGIENGSNREGAGGTGAVAINTVALGISLQSLPLWEVLGIDQGLFCSEDQDCSVCKGVRGAQDRVSKKPSPKALVQQRTEVVEVRAPKVMEKLEQSGKPRPDRLDDEDIDFFTMVSSSNSDDASKHEAAGNVEKNTAQSTGDGASTQPVASGIGAGDVDELEDWLDSVI